MNAVIQFPQSTEHASATEPRRQGGRPRGSQNKLPADLRAKLRNVLEGSVGDAWTWLRQAAQNDPAEGVRLWIAMAQYVLPRLTATAIADITPPPPAPIRERLANAKVDERALMSPRVAELIASGEVQNLDELLTRVGEQQGEVIDVEAAELDPLVR